MTIPTPTVSWEEFCKRRHWTPTAMGVELDHYKQFVSQAETATRLAERERIMGIVEELKHGDVPSKKAWSEGYDSGLTDLISRIEEI